MNTREYFIDQTDATGWDGRVISVVGTLGVDLLEHVYDSRAEGHGYDYRTRLL